MLVRYFLIWFLFFLPLFFPPIFADLYDVPKILLFYFSSFLLIIWTAFLILLRKSLFLPKKDFLKLLFLFCFVYLLSTIFSIHKLTSLIGTWGIKYGIYTGSLIHLVTLVLMFLAVLQLRPEKNFLKEITPYLVSSATLASIYGIYQYLQKFLKHNPTYRIRSTIGDPNRLAFFLATILPLAIALFLEQKKTLPKILVFLGIVFIFITIILTFSRASWIVILILFLISLLSNMRSLKNLIKGNQRYLLAFLFLGFLMLFFQGSLLTKRITSIVNDLKEQKGSTFIRLLEWQTGFTIFKNQSFKNKIIGSGPETLRFTYLQFRPVKLNQFYPEKTWRTFVLRNQYLHYLNTIGIAGLFLFLLIIGFVVNYFYRFRIKSGITEEYIYQKGFFYGWLAIVFSSIFYFQTITSHCYFWVFMAVILSSPEVKKVKFKKPLFLNVVLGFFMVLAVLGLISLVSISRSLIYAKQKNLAKAVAITPFFDFLWQEYSLQLQNEAYAKKDQKIIKEAILAAEKALEINPLEPLNLSYLHAALYKGSGYLKMDKRYQKQALAIAQKWTDIDPTSPVAFDALGLSFLDLGQREKALENFQKAMSLDSDHLVSCLHAGEALKQMGKIEEAISYYQKALEKRPSWSFAQQEFEKAKELLDKHN